MNQLPLDLIDRILTSLPDFDTLCATILVSKSIYNVFKIRPTSIKASVTFNIAGPSAKQAMALSNIQWDLTVEFYEEDNIKDYPSCRVQGTQLLERAHIVASFEALFSRRFVFSALICIPSQLSNWAKDTRIESLPPAHCPLPSPFASNAPSIAYGRTKPSLGKTGTKPMIAQRTKRLKRCYTSQGNLSM